MRYVALLRGVNVGGHRRVPKMELQTTLESLGFYDVTVYLNSGNAVFTSDTVVDSNVVQLALERHFNFSVPTLIMPGGNMQKIADAIPPEWTNDTPRPDKTGNKSDVLCLFDEINTPDILDTVSYKPDIEKMIYVDGAIVTTISRANQSRGSLQKLVGTNLYAKMTIRNVNTARKLAQLVGADVNINNR